ncbi:hypothetical protein EI94DRAFT_1812093 [Lactarius quietus]|nr:hypothetical protein EI94DRAFT_1812093 [Lactarius quietus]
MDANAVDGEHVGGSVPTETPDQTRSGKDKTPFIELFPSRLAGAPIFDLRHDTQDQLQNGLNADNIWAPFQSQCDWEFAQWVKDRGPSSTAVTELLAINGVVESLGLSYHNARELNHIIDEGLPS